MLDYWKPLIKNHLLQATGKVFQQQPTEKQQNSSARLP
jgi:hypothetical protein